MIKEETMGKISSEYEAFCGYKLNYCTPEEILKASDEIYWKGQIKDFFENDGLNSLSDEDCATLLKADNILSSVYKNFTAAADKNLLDAVQDTVKEIEYKQLPLVPYRVKMGINGYIYEGEENIGDLINDPNDPDFVLIKDIINNEEFNYDFDNNLKDVKDKEKLCFISGYVEKEVIAKSSYSEYSYDGAVRIAENSIDFGNIIQPRIAAGCVMSLSEVIADDVEQILFERGEYEDDGGYCQGLSRKEVYSGLENMLSEGSMFKLEDLKNYLEGELLAMGEDDETREKVEKSIKDVESLKKHSEKTIDKTNVEQIIAKTDEPENKPKMHKDDYER